MADGTSRSGQVSVEPGYHYDRVTEAWRLIFGDELHYGVFEDPEIELRQATARLTELMIQAARFDRPGAEVLDVGSGTGVIACRLAHELGAKVLGITTSEVGVGAGTRTAARLGLSAQVRFELRDGTDNQLPAQAFDIVWVLESSHLMRRREQLLYDCTRVLRPEGRLTLCDLMLLRDLDFMEVRALRKQLALLRDVFGDAHMERMDRYVGWLEGAGLVVDTSQDLTDLTRPTFVHWRANIEAHAAEIERLIGAPSMRQFHDSTFVLEKLWDDGIMGYGLVAGSVGAD